MYHPWPLRPSLPQNWGSHPTQNFNRYYLTKGQSQYFKFGRYIRRVHPKKSPLKIFEKRERGRIHGLSNFFSVPPLMWGLEKATDFKFGKCIHRVHPNKSPINNLLRKWSVGVSRDCTVFWCTPYYLRNGWIHGLKIWQIHLQGLSEQKPVKNFREKAAWAYPGTAQFSGTPYHLRHGERYGFQIWQVHSQDPSEQKPTKNFRDKGAWAYPDQGLSNFFGYPLLSPEREKLRISNLASTFTGPIRTKSH